MNMLRNRGNALPTSNGYGYDNGGGGGGYSNTGDGYGGYNGGGGGTGYGGDVYGNNNNNNNSHSHTYKDKARSRGGGSEPWKNPLVLYGVAVFLVLTTLYYRSSGNSLLKALNVKSQDAAVKLIQGLQQDVAKMKKQGDQERNESQRKSSTALSKAERERKNMQKERDALRVKHEGPAKFEEDARIVARELAFQTQVAALRKATKRESLRTVLERFGPGPHHVKFTFELPNADFTVYTPYDFVVELAPLNTLPHAVHLFLEQVAHNLWNGCYFYLNGPHVLQAGPQNFEEDDTEIPLGESPRYPALKPFKDLGLEELAFPEYSDTFPHQTWTLGFTGRPGGPDFYINKVDNSLAHGPGGQTHHVLHEQGDSCFAKIVQGREHVARIYQQAVTGDDTDWHFFLWEPIEITSAVILNWPLPVVPQPQQPPTTDAQMNYNNHNHNPGQMQGTNYPFGVPPAQLGMDPMEPPPQLQQQQDQQQQQAQAQNMVPPVPEIDPVVDMINAKLKRKPKMAKFDPEVDP